MSKIGLKKLLQTMDKVEMISLILEMYDAKKEIRGYLDYYVNPNEMEQFKKAKQIIEREYFPARGFPKERLSVAKKAISDFSSLKASPELEAELLIFLVECGCRLTNEYGDMSEAFYTGMENNLKRALQFMKKHGLLEKFRPNVKRCVEWASPCGFGFSDEVQSLFNDYYPG
jgi:hypothetical protein